jgi:hypothetical protein
MPPLYRPTDVDNIVACSNQVGLHSRTGRHKGMCLDAIVFSHLFFLPLSSGMVPLYPSGGVLRLRLMTTRIPPATLATNRDAPAASCSTSKAPTRLPRRPPTTTAAKISGPPYTCNCSRPTRPPATRTLSKCRLLLLRGEPQGLLRTTRAVHGVSSACRPRQPPNHQCQGQGRKRPRPRYVRCCRRDCNCPRYCSRHRRPRPAAGAAPLAVVAALRAPSPQPCTSRRRRRCFQRHTHAPRRR